MLCSAHSQTGIISCNLYLLLRMNHGVLVALSILTYEKYKLIIHIFINAYKHLPV